MTMEWHNDDKSAWRGTTNHIHNSKYQSKQVFFLGQCWCRVLQQNKLLHVATKYAYSQQLQMRWGINQPTTYWHPCLLFRKSIPKYVIPEIPSRANSGGAYEKARKNIEDRLEPHDAKLHVHPPSRVSLMRGGTHVQDRRVHGGRRWQGRRWQGHPTATR